VKGSLVSKYDNKIELNLVPLYYFCVSHSAQQNIIIKNVNSYHLLNHGESEEET